MATLYRKYRPQKFAQVVGQNHIKLTLEHELKSGQLAHAYLFCGPRAVGKTTLARVLAKSLNCLERKEGEAEPCDHCVACQDIVAGRAMDIIEIDAASHTGVDNVRENVIANARVTPVSLKYKIFIIDEVHMLSTAAFNALLKIMEEPPEFVVFVLCTTEVHKIPTTIISRCQRFDFKKISVSDIVKKLEFMVREEKVEVEAGVLEAVARYSGGHMRDAESALGQILSLSEDSSGHLSVSSADATLVIPRNDISEVMSLLELVAKKDAGGAIDLINRVLYDGFDLKVFVADTLEILRQALLIKISPQLIASLGVDLGESLEARLIEVISGLGVKDLIRILERMMRVQQELKESAIIQLPLEMAVAELCLETLAPAPISQPVLVAETKATTTPNIERVFRPAGSVLSLADIQSKWNEFLIKVKRINHSMSFVLKVCQPVSVDGQTVCLAFRHKIHKDRISETEIKRMVEDVLKEVYNEDLLISTMIDENISLENWDLIDKNGLLSNNEAEAVTKTEPNDEAINNILKNLGGKIVG
jgi:DNA polymerase-3 subunit gamma/tau